MTVLIEIAVCAVINTFLCVILLSKDKNVQIYSFEKLGLFLSGLCQGGGTSFVGSNPMVP